MQYKNIHYHNKTKVEVTATCTWIKHFHHFLDLCLNEDCIPHKMGASIHSSATERQVARTSGQDRKNLP